MSEIKKLTDLVLAFREERDWKQFHNPKDCAISLSLEASEVLEHFQWKNPEEIKSYIENHRDDIGEELADVFYWVLLMSHDLWINLEDAFRKKIIKSGEKYPVDKSKGKSTKYTKL